MKLEFSGNRRSFIKTVALLGGVAAWLGPGRASAEKTKPAPLPPRPAKSSQGYHITEHIKKYYETARL